MRTDNGHCFVSPLPSTLQAREELRPVKEDFEVKNKQLLDEMPKFYHSRIDYFQPSFEALIRAQVSDPNPTPRRCTHNEALPHAHTNAPLVCDWMLCMLVKQWIKCLMEGSWYCPGRLHPQAPNLINLQWWPTLLCLAQKGLICLAPLQSCWTSSNLKLLLKQLGVWS